MLIDLRLRKKEDEGLREYLWRIGKMNETGELSMTWEELTPVLNDQLGTDFTESAFRKKYMEGVAWKEIFSDADTETGELEQLRQERQEINKSRVLLRDERNELNRRLREQARAEDQIGKIGERLAAVGMEHFPEKRQDLAQYVSGEEMIVCISDMHIGASFDSVNGSYDSKIAYNRMAEYALRVTKIAELHGVRKCHIAILGDNINGLIHEAMRITNRENVVEQIKTCAELLTEFIYSLSAHFESIYVTSVPGNHSRLMPNKDADLIDERLDDIIPWYIASSLRHIKNVEVDERKSMYGTFREIYVCNKDYVLVHGDDDSLTEAGISRLAMWLGHIPYCVISGHKHVPAMMDISGVVCVQSGCLSGSGDRFTAAHRLIGDPSQTVLICNEKGIQAMYPVRFDS